MNNKIRNCGSDRIIGKHPKILAVLELISKIVNINVNILIQGESGTGKELIARTLHMNSYRHDKAFVPVNCGAIPDHLLESELFGHVKGAFTGAMENKIGYVKYAEGGTFFLDEVNNMSFPFQLKLLRLLQNGEYYRVGSPVLQKSNIRIVAATSENLEELVEAGKFMEELYYRLNNIIVYIPPLRTRQCDISILAKYFIDKYSTFYEKENIYLSKECESVLLNYNFPGNIRELENTIQRACILCEGTVIKPEYLSEKINDNNKNIITGYSDFKISKQYVVEKFEKDYIMECLRTTKGNISKAARIAGINMKNFYTKMSKYKINHMSFK